LIKKFNFAQQEKNPRAEGATSIYVDQEEMENRRYFPHLNLKNIVKRL
jgi:hypothetical protein